MVVQVKPSSLRLFFFLAISTFILGISFWLMQSRHFELNKGLLAIGSSLDMVVLIPLAYYFTIRKTSISKLSTVPVSVLCLILAYQIIPAEHQTTLFYLELLIAPLELVILGLLVINVGKISKSVKNSGHGLRTFPETLKQVLLNKGVSPLVSNLVTTESSLFYYAFFGWKKPALLKTGEFSNYKASGYKSVFVTILFLLPIETVALHFWLASYSHVVAWVLTGISIYSVFFILGDRNAVYHRPNSLGEKSMFLSTGIRWQVELPYNQIESLDQREGDETKEKFLNFSTFGHGNLVIKLKSPITVRGLYGIKKTTETLVLSIDRSDLFSDKVREKISSI